MANAANAKAMTQAVQDMLQAQAKADAQRFQMQQDQVGALAKATTQAHVQNQALQQQIVQLHETMQNVVNKFLCFSESSVVGSNHGPGSSYRCLVLMSGR